MADIDKTDALLEEHFAAARRSDADMSGDLAARMLADAAAVQSGWSEPVPVIAPRLPIWRQLVSVLGGFPTLGGLVTAAVAGIWLGVSPPEGLDPLALVFERQSELYLMQDTDLQDLYFSEEG